MSIQQIMGISKRMGLQVYRSKWTIPYLILFPGFFIMIYWFGFSTSEIGTNRTYHVGIVNEDTGFPDELQTLFEKEAIQNVLTNNNTGFLSSLYITNIIENGFSFDFISVLEGLKYTDNPESKNIFEIDIYENKNRKNDEIKNRRTDVVLELSPTFSLSVLSVFNHYWKINNGVKLDSFLQSIDPEVPDFADFDVETIELFGDQNYLHFNQAKTLLELFIGEYFNPRNYGEGLGGQISYHLIEDSEVSIPTYSTFEILLPGIIIFGIIIQPSLFAAFLCEEFRPGRRTFDRIKVSPLSASSYILGSLLIQIPIMLIQTLILFLFGVLFG
ncbi:MAG: ABC transporter permease, partial [Candidatus Kariarchaeaceae archaeon]